jgi:putative ABC transport system permease protein
MAIGLYITYKILDLSDLTVDGSFCTGGAVCIVMIAMGYPTYLAMICAFLAGMIAGAITGILHTICKIPAILAGILTQLGLWTVNMLIMGLQQGELISTLTIPARNSSPFVSAMYLAKALDGSKPIYLYPPLSVGILTLVIIALLYWFFGTERGASIRATGANENMARAQGINTSANKMIGLMLANGLVALSGSLFAQYNGNAEINMGRGAIVIGLAAIIIGDVLFGKLFKNFALKLLAVSFGAIIYYIVIQAVLTLLKVDSNYLKLMSAAIVAVFLAVSNLSGKHGKHHKKKEVPACSK